jgi:hypothetical protein
VAVTDSSSGLPEQVSAYAYDALGRRLSKTVFSGGLPPVITHFVYADGGIIEERDNGTLKRTYAFPHVFEQRGRIMFTDLGETLYCHDDDLGNALAITDASGTVIERYEYADFGAVSFLTSDGVPNPTGTSSKGFLYCWGGLRVDPETGLHNNGGGDYYDPLTGRAVRGKVKDIRDSGMGFIGNNPWSAGGGSGGLKASDGKKHFEVTAKWQAMKKGTVKFFNEAKGFGFIKEDSGQDSKHYITIPHNLSRSSAAYGVEYLNGRKESAGHVTVLK